MNISTKNIFIALLLILNLNLFGQQTISYNSDLYIPLEKVLNNKNCSFHTAFKPYFLSLVDNPINMDSTFNVKKETRFIKRKLLSENLIIFDTTDLYLTIDPIFNFEVGSDLDGNNSFFKNTRGAIIQSKIGNKLSFKTSMYENQARFPEYVRDYIKKYNIIPGQTTIKQFKDDSTTFDYSTASGLVSYSISKTFNVQFGHDKNFIGDGYRSLLLSDYAFQYPFVKVTSTFGKFQYVNMLSSFLNPQANRLWYGSYQKKTGSFNYLSINVSKSLQLGLFEAIIFEVADSSGKRFDINYINPLIFSRSIQYSLNSENNALVGLNIKYRLTNSAYLYGQLLIDDIKLSELNAGYLRNKYGYQVGFKYFDVLGLKNLNIQSEYNQVQPYTYTSESQYQNYTQLNQPLAHPLGANFKESVSFLNYRYKRWFVELKVNYIMYGGDNDSSHYGKEILLSDCNAELGYNSFNNKILQGINTTLIYKEARINYLLNPRTNMNLVLGISNRTLKVSGNTYNSNFVYFGFRTSLVNYYYDF